MFSTDSCQCPCTTNGCLPIRVLFASFSSTYGLVSNLSAITLFLELVLLLGSLEQSSINPAYLDALFRLQKFDELGMKHTCCTGRCYPLSRFENVSPFYCPPREDEFAERATMHSLVEEEEELVEIREEEECYADILESHCVDGYASNASSVEVELIRVLSRRAVMIEEILVGVYQRKTRARKEKQAAINKLKVRKYHLAMLD